MMDTGHTNKHATESRRAALSKLLRLGGGVAAIQLFGSGSRSAVERILQSGGPELSYQPGAKAEPQELRILPQAAGRGAPWALGPLPMGARKAVIDGHHDGYAELSFAPPTEEIYLNQAYMSGIEDMVMLRTSQVSEDTQGEPRIRHTYHLRLIDGQNGAPLEIVYHAAPQSPDAPRPDPFPIIRLFKSDGRLLDFALCGSDLTEAMPEADAQSLSEFVIRPCKHLLQPYLEMRERARNDSDYYESTFKTSIAGTPLSQKRDPLPMQHLLEAIGGESKVARHAL